MNFYNYIFATVLIFNFLHKCSTDGNPELTFPEGGLEAPSPFSVGLIFFVKINNTSDNNDYDVEVTPDQCCLEEENAENCEYLQILGGCSDFVSKGEVKTLKVIAPILDQYDRKGYCSIYVDSKVSTGTNKRDTIKINFDTTYENIKFKFLSSFKHCKHKDEDPFNNCKPVECESYYNGKRPYFSRKLKRCIEVPSCVSVSGRDYPSILYNPITNQCVEQSLDQNDLIDIKKINKHNKKRSRKPKEIIIVQNFHHNATDNIKNVLIDDIIPTTSSVEENNTMSINSADLHVEQSKHQKYNSDCLISLFKRYIVDSTWALMVLALVITLQCFLIFTMLYCLSKSCTCPKDKEVIRKYFNYRQDASVTTPLIGTSNMETETTDYQYLTESSHVDQKIKCYKACQKEKNNNMKVSMSDDILSKCLNRRDWRKFKAEPITISGNNVDGEINSGNVKNDIPKIDNTILPNEIKVTMECENKNEDNKKPKVVNIVSNAEILSETKGNQDIEANFSSEKEIKCHSYNRYDAGIAGFRANLEKNTGVFQVTKSKKGSASNSTEKGAQAYFSNDSIDDFLSERGMIYLAGENMSKYTFSSDSNDIKPSTTSSVSSKTSKNFVKNVLSLLHRRSKQGPSSDPGQNKEVDIELIHMSKASVYSSTNDSDSNHIKTFKRKDSRTSF